MSYHPSTGYSSFPLPMSATYHHSPAPTTPDYTLDNYIHDASNQYLSHPPRTATRQSLLSHICDNAPICSLGYRRASIYKRAEELLLRGALGRIASNLPATSEDLLEQLLSGHSGSIPTLSSAVDEAELTLPREVQLTLLSPLLAAIEKSAFEYTLKQYPEIIHNRGWLHPHAAKATEWLRALNIEVPAELEGVEEAVLSKGRIRMKNDTVLGGLEAAEHVIGEWFQDSVLEQRVNDLREDLKNELGRLRKTAEKMRREVDEEVTSVLRGGVNELGSGLRGWAGVEGREYPEEEEVEGEGDDGDDDDEEEGEEEDDNMDDAEEDEDDLDDEEEDDEEDEEEKGGRGAVSLPYVRREMDGLRVNSAKRPRLDRPTVARLEYAEYGQEYPVYPFDDGVRIKVESPDSRRPSVTIKEEPLG